MYTDAVTLADMDAVATTYIYIHICICIYCIQYVIVYIYIYRPRAKMENTSFMEGASFDRLGILQQPSLLVGYNGVYST